MEIDLSRFRDTFFQEAAEHIENFESGLLSLQAGTPGPDTLNAIFRCAHSIKAAAGMFGFDATMRLTHVLENLLDGLRNGEMETSQPLLELLLQSVDVLRALLDAAARDSEPPAHWEKFLQQLDRAKKSGAAPSPSPAAQEYLIRFEPGPALFRLGLDPLLVLGELSQLGALAAEADLTNLPPLESLDPEACYLRWRLRLRTAAVVEQVRDAFAFVEDVAAVAIEPAAALAAGPAAAAEPMAARPAAHEGSIRVAASKVDRLIDLVGELVIAHSVAAELMNAFTPDRLPRLQEAMAEMERYTRELQESAMHIRMTPVASVFSRFPRLVHDTARALGKEVTLHLSGEDTEMDKGVVERIADPLTHLVRNAVDHGIEAPADREAAGKPVAGNLRLNAYHQSGNVVVEVSDDGHGLDTARIRAKGIECGLIASGDELSDEQIHALIFRPGFSTAAAVSDVSGRGVGMDVVKKSVDGLSGSVTIESKAGRGSTVRLKLPLTLAILDGLLLRVADQTYVMPLVSIVESIRPHLEQVLDVAGRGEVVVVRGQPLPLLRLGGLFHIPAAVIDPCRGLVVIVEQDDRQVAMLVDELLGQQQVVVKSLETNFHKVAGIAGATILGDGRAALILDAAEIVAMGRAA